MDERSADERLLWLGVNAYGLLIAMLVLLVGLRYVFNPTGFLMSGVGHVGYFISGVSLLVAYWKVRADLEVYASVLLFASNFLILLSRLFGTTGFDLWNTTLTVVVGVVVALRTRALIQGGGFTLPAWRKR